MILVLDTETNGLPVSYQAPVSDVDNWPRVVQLGWALYDNKGVELTFHDLKVKPDGWTISSENALIHGVTQDIAMAIGLPVGWVMDSLELAMSAADVVVAHNIEFDMNVLGAEFARLGRQLYTGERFKYCTMRNGADVCKIPGRYGFKWPRLSELYHFLFDEELTDAHKAMSDVRATAKCFFKMREQLKC